MRGKWPNIFNNSSSEHWFRLFGTWSFSYLPQNVRKLPSLISVNNIQYSSHIKAGLKGQVCRLSFWAFNSQFPLSTRHGFLASLGKVKWEASKPLAGELHPMAIRDYVTIPANSMLTPSGEDGKGSGCGSGWRKRASTGPQRLNAKYLRNMEKRQQN